MASFCCQMFFPLHQVLTYGWGILDQSLKEFSPESSLNDLDIHYGIIYVSAWTVQHRVLQEA